MNSCSQPKRLLKACTFLIALTLLIAIALPAYPQEVTSAQRSLAGEMLRNIKQDVKRNFYDLNFRGVDLEAKLKETEGQILQAKFLGQLYGVIANYLLELNEPNTFFVPPTAFTTTDYGWDWELVGDKCYVTAVKPGSDAEAKGVRVGDEIFSIGGYQPTKNNAWKIKYAFFIGNPQKRLSVAIRSLGGQSQQREILSQRMVKSGSNALQDFNDNADRLNRELKSQTIEIDPGLLLWKLYSLSAETGIGDALKRARKYKSLIIDLRGCREAIKNWRNDRDSQYSVNRLQEIIGYLFDRDIKVADLKKRKDQKPILAKTRGENAFNGKLVIIVDNDTSSISEVVARIIQLEKRGVVIGDRTNGTTRLSTGYLHGVETGMNSATLYGVVIAERELIMSDGQSLDGVGVTPDETVLPTGSDLGNNRDPVLSRAAELLGGRLSPDKAGSLIKRINYTLWMK